MCERDPRRDPRPGDYIQRPDDGRTVVEVRDDVVFFRYHSDALGNLTLDRWREWAAPATIVSVRGVQNTSTTEPPDDGAEA